MIGKTVSHYRVVAELGRGGMGVVYEAEHTRLKQPVALKFLPKELTGDAAAKTRFMHEAQAASSLKHHHVCTIHDIDETKDGRLFICMDVYEGGSLKERIEQGPIEVGEAIDLATQVADGLSAAHDAGIVHRDIKPANILLTKTGEAKIADFGLAKLTDRTRVTKTGTTVGTAAYMSPEQTQGHDVDKPSDVWSLGVMLYQMLAGEFPFQGDHDVALAYGIVNTNPVPLSVHRADVPGGVQTIIDKCLAKNPTDRYPSATELRDELKALQSELASGSDTVRRVSTGSSATRGRTGGRRMAIIAAVIIAIAAFAIYKFYPRPAAAEQAIAVVDFQDLSGGNDPTLSAGITSLVNVGLIENSPIRVVSTSYLHELRRRLFKDTEGSIGKDQAMAVARKSGASVALIGEVSLTGGDQLVIWQLVDTKSGRAIGAKTARGADVLVCADAVVAEVIPFLNRMAPGAAQSSMTLVQEVSTTSPEAYKHFIAGVLHYEQGRTSAAVRDLKRAVAIDSSFALAHLYLSKASYGSAAGAVGDIDLALIHADAAWRHREGLDLKEQRCLEARRHWIDGRHEEAYKTYEEILEQWPDDLQTLEDYSSNLYYSWDFRKTSEIATKALDLYPESERLLAMGWSGLAGISEPERALVVARWGATRHSDNPNSWDNLGLAYLATGQPDSAEYAFRQALSIDPGFLWSLEGLAFASYCRGDTRGGIETLRSILTRSDLQGPEGIGIQLGYHVFGQDIGLAELGRCHDALELVNDTWRRYAGHNEGLMKRIGYSKCRVLMRMGRFEEVVEFARTVQDSLSTERRIWAFEWFPARGQISLGNYASTIKSIDSMQSKRLGKKVEVYAIGVRAELELAQGQPMAAIEMFNEFRQNGGFVTLWGMLEGRTNLAQAYHMAGRSDEAIAELEELLRVYKGHALGHYELGKIYQDLDRTADAQREYTTFLDMWSEADEDMPQLIDARARLDRISEGSI